MAFRFKQFEVEDEHSTLRIGTDAMLLGAWARPGNARRILEIGTGCGVLALMMAQKSTAIIEAIDIDLPSVNEARGNFTRSPWHERLFAFNDTLLNFTGNTKHGYDFIITNPPYFLNSLRSPSSRKNSTRHDQSLSREELVQSVTRILAPGGTFAVILPADGADEFIACCRLNGMFLRHWLMICPKPTRPPMRTLMEFIKNPSPVETGLKPISTGEPALTVRDASGNFTDEYLALTHDFHDF